MRFTIVLLSSRQVTRALRAPEASRRTGLARALAIVKAVGAYGTNLTGQDVRGTRPREANLTTRQGSRTCC